MADTKRSTVRSAKSTAAAVKKEAPEKEESAEQSEKQRKSLDDYDPEMRKLILEELRRSEKRRKMLMLFFVLVMLCGFGAYGFYYFTAGKGDARSAKISAQVGNSAMDGAVDKDGKSIYIATLTDENGQTVQKEVLEKYKKLYFINKDLIGYIKIDDTNIDGPVVQGSDNEFYLSHDFYKEDDVAGTLFLDSKCDIVRGNDNFIIYGHHLQSGRMFSKLSAYESKDYCDRHPYIQFDTIYEEGTYQVMYAFRSRVYDADQVVFKYYQFLDAAGPEEFLSNMEEMKKLAYYDTGVTAVYGDKLLTLSTCDYNEQNGRFVVVAKKIR
ncbi:MAG: class B sortase [Lachnospiraceae bacterium]|nr:class B sortase [Lachnospiraceae bacterium]